MKNRVPLRRVGVEERGDVIIGKVVVNEEKQRMIRPGRDVVVRGGR